MKKRKITFVIGNRAHYARIRPTIKHLPKGSFKLVLFDSAVLSDYGNVKDQIFSDLGKGCVDVIYTNINGGNLVTMTKSTGIAIFELSSEFERNRPDIVVVVADRYEALAATVAARYMNIPVAHIQGGENTGSIDDNIRHSITKLSNIHLVTNNESAERVRKMGEKESSIYVVGCPTIDVCNELPNKNLNSLFEKYAGVYETKFTLQDKYIIVSFHPVTTEYSQNKKHFKILYEAINSLDIQTIWLYPNIDAGTDLIRKEIYEFKSKDKKGNIHFFKHFDTEDYLGLLKNSQCIVGNSSVGIRESSFLGVPSVTVGSRQRGRVRAKNVVDSDVLVGEIKRAVLKQIQHGHYLESHLYGDGGAGKKIAEVLLSCDLSIDKFMTY